MLQRKHRVVLQPGTKLSLVIITPKTRKMQLERKAALEMANSGLFGYVSHNKGPGPCRSNYDSLKKGNFVLLALVCTYSIALLQKMLFHGW